MSVLTPSGEQLVILLNETFTPPTIFSDANISFGTPTVAPDGSTGFDTIVIGTGIPGLGYYGTAEIHYTRCPLSNLGSSITLNSETAFTLDMLCSMLNSQFATFLDPTDLVPITIPPLTIGNSEQVTLTAADSSLGWEGSVTITLTYAKPYLKSVIGNVELATMTDALTGSSGFLNGKQFLASIDFTSYRDAIKPTLFNSGLWYANWGFADYTSLSDVCSAIGIPSFPQPDYRSSVTDYATSAVPDSNQSFDRVVVYNQVLGGKFYPGPIYFHYNLLDNR